MNDASDADIAVFTEALRLPREERDGYLSEACKGDPKFRRRVQALLDSYDQAGDFLGRSAAERPPKAARMFPAEEKPGDRIGHYKLLQQIGEGGCGVVYMAEQEEPVRRRVALKIIKPGMDTKNVIARFEAERQALALMDHPNIAKVFDAGATESGRPYFVMELVRGVKITEYCNEHSLTTEDRLKLFVQVCQAVQHAHQRGIIHRDIKPSNILVTQLLEGVATPMVIDFGVAKATTDQRLTDKTVFTAFEMLIGTPAYMSPEQAALSTVDVDTRTDIYSLGVLLYELLTSSTPFETGELLKAGLDEIRRVIREQEPPRPSTRLSKMLGANLTTVAQQRRSEPPRLIHTIQGDLDWIAMKALEKDRTRRYETANGLALDVKRFLENEPVSARPPSKLYKFQKLVRRNRLLFISVGVIATLLVMGLVLVSALLAREHQALHDSERDKQKAQQVKEFLEGMLDLDPKMVKGRDTAILREILDKAAARVGKLSNEPGVEGELRSVIGTAYLRTGQYGQAEEMQRAALEICRKRFGRESLETASALNDLGLALIANGRRLEAEKVNREALEIRRRHFGDENADVATSKDNLAHACNDNGKFTEAEALVREALATRRKLLGSESQEVADSLRNLALILTNTRKGEEAEAAMRKVLALRRKLLGSQHPIVANALYDLAWTLTMNGKQKEAEALQREAFALLQKVSDNYADVAASLKNLGDRMREKGNLDDAHSVLTATLSLQRKLLGDDHQDTLYTLNSLALTYEAQTNWSEAESVMREAVASRRKRWGNDDLQTIYAIRGLAEAIEGQGKWAEAEALRREALLSWRKRAGNSDAQTLREFENLAKVLMRQKRFGETERLLEEALAPAVVGQPSSSNLLAQRVELMGRQGRWQEAATTATLVVEYQPTEHYHTLAALLAITRNRPAYEMLCRKILATFDNTSNPYINEQIAKDCLLLPDSGVDLELVDKLADKAVLLGSGYSNAAYFQVAKAMSAYRLGHFAESIEWAEKTLKSSIIYPNAHAYAILAMAHWKLGQKDVARVMLEHGDALTPNIAPRHEAVDLGDSWVAWLLARISLDEATALIQPALKTESNSQNP